MSKFDSLNDTFNTDDGVEVDSIVKAEDTEIQTVSYTHLTLPTTPYV